MSVRDTCPACRCWSRRDVVFLTLLLGFGLLLRFLGMSYGLPSVFHPDETRQVLDALSMGQRHSLLPVDHTYPALHKYLLLAVYGGYYFVGLLFGWFRSPVDFAVQYFAEPTMFYWLGRLLSVLAGTLLGAVLYLAGRRFYSTACGWIAALFGLSMIHLVGHSQWALPDIFLTLTCTIAICYLYAYMDSQRVSHAVLAGLWAGMAISTKYQGLFLLLPFVLAHLRVFAGSASRRALWRPVLWSAVTLALASLAGNLAWVFQYREIRQKFAELSGIGILGISSGETFSPGIAGLLAWFARELVWQEGLLGLVLLAGAAYALYRHTARDLVALSFVALSLYALSGWGVRYLHLFVSTFGVLCLLGARLCDELLSRIRPARRDRLVGVISLAIVAGSLFAGARIGLEKSRPDTRETALEWVTTNIPAGTRIAVDWFELGPQLPGVTPVAVSNPRAVEYWENEIDPALKEAYLQRTRGRTTYPLLSAMYATDQPAWPKEMPPEVVAKASAYPAVKHLYSRFNFYSLQQLKQQGAQYLVISSFAYSHFLLDDDPRKTGLFDPYGVEDTLANNRQAPSYRADSFHSLLFYLVKNAREFYLPLLSRQRGPEFELVYEVRPTGGNWGPVVKIFRLP